MSNLHTLSTELRASVQNNLNAGERVMWTGQPNAGRAMIKHFGIWFFAIPWLMISSVFFGFALMAVLYSVMGWSGGPKNDGKEMQLGMAIFFLLFSTPFMGLGLAMLFSPFYMWREYSRTLYVITDQRLFSIVRNKNIKLKSVNANGMGLITRTERSNGTGSLIIQTGTSRDSEGTKTIDTFDVVHVPDVAQAERYLNEIISRS